ncbi:MAG: sigma-54 interaction domain-containing protein [Gemmatimonadales bacterium]
MKTPDAVLVVVPLTDSFGEFWPLLAAELKVPLVVWQRGEAESPPPNAAAVLLAAGGREPDLPAVLANLAVPAGIPVFAVGATLAHRLVAQAVAAGAADYFALPDDRDALHDAVQAAISRRRAAFARGEHARLEAQAHAFREIVGTSPALHAALERAARVLPHADATILILGETGTGKELLARALHYGGPRARGPFIELNCAALPAPLLESELFGHERGAFTDAKTAKPGLFEAAEGGTLLLDEINQLALELQAKLLRALEQKATRRLGATTTRQFDVRIIAATNGDLEQDVRAGRFRQDLFYRLNVVSLSLPPLRDRGNDVLQLADAFLQRFCAQYGLPVPSLGEAQRRALLTHSWPGNVRELRNTIERALLLSTPGTLALGELRADAARPASGSGLPFPATLQEIIAAAAQAMVEATGGNRSEAARRLGISRSRLQRLLQGEPDSD